MKDSFFKLTPERAAVIRELSSGLDFGLKPSCPLPVFDFRHQPIHSDTLYPLSIKHTSGQAVCRQCGVPPTRGDEVIAFHMFMPKHDASTGKAVPATLHKYDCSQKGAVLRVDVTEDGHRLTYTGKHGRPCAMIVNFQFNPVIVDDLVTRAWVGSAMLVETPTSYHTRQGMGSVKPIPFRGL